MNICSWADPREILLGKSIKTKTNKTKKTNQNKTNKQTNKQTKTRAEETPEKSFWENISKQKQTKQNKQTKTKAEDKQTCGVTTIM